MLRKKLCPGFQWVEDAVPKQSRGPMSRCLLLRSSLGKPVPWEQDPPLSAWGEARDEHEGAS